MKAKASLIRLCSNPNPNIRVPLLKSKTCHISLQHCKRNGFDEIEGIFWESLKKTDALTECKRVKVKK